MKTYIGEIFKFEFEYNNRLMILTEEDIEKSEDNKSEGNVCVIVDIMQHSLGGLPDWNEKLCYHTQGANAILYIPKEIINKKQKYTSDEDIQKAING